MVNDRTKRRTVIRLLALAAAAPAIASAGRALAADDGKAKKVDMKYQDHPLNGLDCDDCIHFQPGKSRKAMGTCEVVEGEISPHGWCIEFQPKKKAGS